jgi:8-oxo-dGTP pyrophosphatase MutT (NUDIX family)
LRNLSKTPRPLGARVGIAAHIARLRAVVGHELLLLPSVSILPVDEVGRVLLVRHAGHDDGWGILGGAVKVGESPAAAAVREAREEIGVDVHLVRLLGGPDYEVSYLNGDRVVRAPCSVPRAVSDVRQFTVPGRVETAPSP